MTKKELNEKILQVEKEIEELEHDLFLVEHSYTKEVLQRVISTSKHTLNQYRKMA